MDQQGRFILPAEVGQRYGFMPGAKVRLDEDVTGFHLSRTSENLARINTCPFIEKASLSVRWDGAVTPCLALFHTHESYLDNHVRKSHAFALGSLGEHTLLELWQDPGYPVPLMFSQSCTILVAGFYLRSFALMLY